MYRLTLLFPLFVILFIIIKAIQALRASENIAHRKFMLHLLLTNPPLSSTAITELSKEHMGAFTVYLILKAFMKEGWVQHRPLQEGEDEDAPHLFCLTLDGRRIAKKIIHIPVS
jgi:hypothetical protein